MELTRAKEIIAALAEEIDPTTGELPPGDNVCNKGEVVRAFYAILNEGKHTKAAAKRAAPAVPAEYDRTLFDLLKELRYR